MEFSYLRVADIAMNNELVNGQRQVGVLYGFADDAVLQAIGLTKADAYKRGNGVFYFTSDKLNKALADALADNATTVKNALEIAVRNGGKAMPETDANGHSKVSGLKQGLYLVVETRVPENVTSTCNPFFVSLPMTTMDGKDWNYDVTVYPKNQTGNPTLEKTVRDEYGITQKLTIHVPQLVCDSPDAEYINNELAAMYAAEYRDYESYPQAEVSQDEWCPQTYIDWDAYWYGDCVSLVVSSYYGGTDPIYSQGWCFDFAAGHKLSVTELLMRMGLDPDETQLAVYRAAIQTFDRNMVQQEYYDSLRESGMLSGMRADTLRDNGLENLTVLLKNENTVTLVAGYHTTAGSGWRPLEVELPLTPAAPAKTPVLTDTYGSVSVLLDGDIRTVTIKHTPEIIAWAEDYDIRLDGDVTLPIRNAYHNYVDVCIGELGASFHPVVYLLTEDGFVEYVDVLRCLLYGQSLLCADPIYIANNGTALALRDAEVSLLCADGTETELAPLTAEWNSPQQVDSTGSFSLGEGENWCWLDLNSGGGCQLATHNNRYFYQGAVTYLGATPDGTALGFSLVRDTENGPEWVAFSAALKLDYSIDCLILTPLSGQNPLTNETVPLVLTHSYG